MSQSPTPPPINSRPDLAADYYLANFQFLVDWVLQRYKDLLSTDERHFLTCFQQLSRTSQCLLVRLSSRKGPLFRRDKLHYAEIDSIEQAAAELIAVGLLSDSELLSIQDLANALTKAELLNLFSAHLQQGAKQARKEELIALLAAQLPESKTWQEWTNQQLGDAYRLDNQKIISTLLLLFFGNTYQDLTEFVLQDLGLYRYENYTIDQQHRIFKTRAELEQYQQLIHLREELQLATEVDDLILLATHFPVPSNHPKLQRRQALLCNQLAYELERANEHSLALQLYCQSHLPPARERRIRLQEKQGDLSGAWQLLNEILIAPCDEHELQVAQRMAPRLAKKLGETIAKRKPSPVIEQQLQLSQLSDEDGNVLRVEEIVRQFAHTDEAPCFYVENLLLTGLFGLWLWPEMFHGIDGAFANPFQAAPLDLYQENFVSNRPGIQQLWQLLDDNQHHDHIREFWRSKNGVTNHFVSWQFLDQTLLDIALQSIPAAHLKAIFERLLFDIKNNRSGLPDLIQFYPSTDDSTICTYRMIEVKGPGDRIQDNQQRWLDYFAAHAIPAEVWYVSWQ
jgi:hypothetical protein